MASALSQKQKQAELQKQQELLLLQQQQAEAERLAREYVDPKYEGKLIQRPLEIEAIWEYENPK